MTLNIGTNYPVTIPSLEDRASIVEAFRYYHTGGLTGSISTTSVEYHLDQFNDRIDVIDLEIDDILVDIAALETANAGIAATYIKAIPSSNTTTATRNLIKPSTSSIIPLIIEGVSGQSANLQEWRIDATTVRARVDQLGKVYSWDGSSTAEVATLTGTQTLTNKSLTSPTLTGTPIAPTADTATNNTQVATTAFVKSSIGTLEINSRSANYTSASADIGKLIIFNAGTTLTIPTNSSVPFPIGSSFSVMQATTSTLTISPASGVTINSTPGNRLRTQWSVATITKIGTDSWLLFGDLMI